MLTVERTDQGISLAIDQAQGAFSIQLKERGWLVRFHLDKGEAADKKAYVDSVEAESGSMSAKATQPLIQKLAPLAFPTPTTSANFPIPFKGEGAAPGPGGGHVIEIWAPAKAIGGKRVITYGF